MDLDTGATAWVLISAALVLLMVPAVGLFYGGMVRKKNVIATMMLSLVALALGVIQWIIIGYSLAFGSDVGGFIGNLEYFGLNGIT
ncbi:MAG TPA: ammonium transporter, partial [Methanocorpusculum sp.]|nr:ammonium transporter [Methanocorpusculum sp.]